MLKESGAKTDAVLAWTDLWPMHVPLPKHGWTEQLPAGVSVLVDETGEETPYWTALLSGHAQPGRGTVYCNGLCSQADRAAYQQQVYWHNPRSDMLAREMSVQQWLREAVLRWPHWNDAAWSQHSEGFGLTEHLSKPLWHLSTGCLRKLGIATALASEAPLTVIEEPVAALDAQSIHYLCQALDALGDAVAESEHGPRWVLVTHWEPLPGVTWDEVLAAPALLART